MWLENRKEKEKENPAKLPSSPLGPPAALASTPSPCSASARASPTPAAWPTCSGQQPQPASTSRGRTHSARTILCDPTCRVAQRDAPRAPLPGSTYQRQRTHTRSLPQPTRPLPPLTDAWTPPVGVPLPTFLSSPRRARARVTGEITGIAFPLSRAAILGTLPLNHPVTLPCAPHHHGRRPEPAALFRSAVL